MRSVGVVIEASKDKVVLAGDYSAPGDELNRFTEKRFLTSLKAFRSTALIATDLSVKNSIFAIASRRRRRG